MLKNNIHDKYHLCKSEGNRTRQKENSEDKINITMFFNF